MKKRLAVLVAMGTLAAFSLGAEAKTYAVEDEDGNTKYITVYDGKVGRRPQRRMRRLRQKTATSMTGKRGRLSMTGHWMPMP